MSYSDISVGKNTKAMQNGEYVSFMSETDRQLIANGIDKLGISGLYPFFHEGIVLAQQTHGVLSVNPLTEAKNKAEHYRDSRYTAFSTFVRSAAYDANPAVSEAADKVLSVIDAIGIAHNELIVQYQTVIAQRKTKAKNAVKDNSPKTKE